jgi:hypothetical protein
MSSDIAWKNKRDKGTSGYAGSTGSERRDAAKKDLYARGKIDAPTEESLNRYYKRGEGQNTDGGGKANQKRAGSYTNRQSMLDSTIAANQSGMGDKTSANTGSFYGSDSAMPQTQGSNTQYDASRATGPLNTSGQAEEEWRRNFLYNPSDPTYAMQQKLTDMGYKLYSPILRASVLPAAEGLGAAWNLGQATGGGAGSMNPAADFSSFLGSVLTGAGGNGIQGTLQNAYGTLTGGGFADKLRSAFDTQSANGAQPNNYLGAFFNLLTDPQAVTSLQQALMGPLSPFAAQGAKNLAAVNTVRGPRTGSVNDDWLKYILGI